MPNATGLGIVNILNGETPCLGPKCIPYTANFALGNRYDFDLTQFIQNNQLENIQTIYVDNSANGNILTITMVGTNQTVVVPKNSCGYYTILMPKLASFSAVTSGTVLVYFAMLNFYIPPTVWSTL